MKKCLFFLSVNTWNGSKSLLDKEAEIGRREAKKRTTDELYNDDFDSGRVRYI